MHGGVLGCAFMVASSAGVDGAADISVHGGVLGCWDIVASPGGVDGAADIADGGKVPTRPEAEEAAASFEAAERLPPPSW